MVQKTFPNKRIAVEYAIRCAQHVLYIFENKYPKDKRPRMAIRVAKRWLKEPTEKNMITASKAAHAAGVAAHAAGVAAWSAAWSAAWAAAHADYAAAYAAAHADYAAAYAAAAARAAADAAPDPVAERRWQDQMYKELLRKYSKK